MRILDNIRPTHIENGHCLDLHGTLCNLHAKKTTNKGSKNTRCKGNTKRFR